MPWDPSDLLLQEATRSQKKLATERGHACRYLRNITCVRAVEGGGGRRGGRQGGGLRSLVRRRRSQDAWQHSDFKQISRFPI